MSFHSQRFGRAAQTYGAHAEVQSLMAERLAGLLPPPAKPEAPRGQAAGAGLRVLEMGCGTGLMTTALSLRLPRASMTVTDASEPMLTQARENLGNRPDTSFAIFDASGNKGSGAPPSPPQSAAPFGLAVSNALVQWFPALDVHLRMVSGLLERSGIYLVSGFLRGNFPELNALLAKAPFHYRDFPGHGREGIAQAAADAGFTVEAWDTDAFECTYPSPEAFLGAIRGLGSSRRPGAAGLTRSGLDHLVTQYQQGYACEGGVRATWKPWYARLRRV